MTGLSDLNDGLESSAAENPAVAVPEAEACPPPLEWQDVLREFHAQAEVWYLDRPQYRLTGRVLGTGRPLYLLGGFGGAHELYALLVWLLRDQYRCVLWDYPGVAPGAKALRGVTLADLAADLAAVAATCGDASIDLYAPSFGTLVALQAALDFPRLVRRAILQGGFARRRLSGAERILTRACRFFPGTLQNFPGSRGVRRHNHRRWFPPFDETRWQFLEESTGRVPVATLAWQATLVRNADYRPRLAAVTQRVLLVETEGEGVASQFCQTELAAALPESRREPMLSTGQYPCLTHPHRVAKLVRSFLEEP